MVWKCKAYGEEETKAKYMQIAKDGSVRKVWSDEGMKRFNVLCSQVQQNRPVSMSKTNETELMKLWNKRRTKNGRAGDTDKSFEGDDSDRNGGGSNRREIIVIFEG
mmetsp:Transcript_3453/g.6529  ORF Transcript_3453/g.6529 Transcript_3453/m.6529 type:complete len:106 (+) Transcript_3453:88-405(+)